MKTAEALRQRVQRTRQLTERLRRATIRLTAVQQERVWAIVSAHQQGLSIRQIALATALSAARVHQLLTDNAAADIPVWLSRLRERDWPSSDYRLSKNGWGIQGSVSSKLNGLALLSVPLLVPSL